MTPGFAVERQLAADFHAAGIRSTRTIISILGSFPVVNASVKDTLRRAWAGAS